MTQKKIFFKISVFLLLCLGTIPSNVHAATFSDVPESNRNYVAIEYLAKMGIIQGYSDKSYQPRRAVSRVEFLKIAIESSAENSKLLQTTTHDQIPSEFKDIDGTAWYAKYVRLAEKKGWIKGYTTANGKIFKPDQKINKVEGFKIIAAIQNWPINEVKSSTTSGPFLDTPLTAWYTPILFYAKEKNFLEENGENFNPSTFFLRGNVSEVLFRTLLSKNNKDQAFSAEMLKNAALNLKSENINSVIPTTSSNSLESKFDPISYQNYSADFFDNIHLNEVFPNTFYKNEVYFFDGNIKNGTYKEAFVFIKNNSTGKFENSVVELTNNNFSIPFNFHDAGNYKLGIILGDSGESKVASIVVLPNLPVQSKSTTPPSASSTSVEFKNNTTTFQWIPKTNTITKLFIIQGREQRTYFFRQAKDHYHVDYKDFKNFNGKNPILFQIESASSILTKPLSIESEWTTGIPGKFDPIQHQFREVHDDQITYSTLPEKLSVPGTVTINGKAKTDIFQNAAVQKPDGTVENVQLITSQPTTNYYGENLIPSGNDYNFQYSFKNTGTYILEINSKNGAAVLNIPIYIQEGIPLLPDFFDLENLEDNSGVKPDGSLDQNALKNQLLTLINAERTKSGLKNVTSDTKLDTFALNYAKDMSDRNFFSHINPEGLGPNDRKVLFKIPTDVSENLAKSPNLLYAHYGFLRSPIHRENVLNPAWDNVGLGFAKNKDGDLLVVEEFSTFPLTFEQLDVIEQNFIQKINQKRQNSGLPLLSLDLILKGVSEDWSALMANENFFDFKAPDGTVFANTLQEKAGNRQVQVLILESNNQEKILKQLLQAPENIDTNFTHIGLGLRYDEVGKFKFTAIYSK